MKAIKIILLCLLAFCNATNAQDIKGKRLYSGDLQNISYLFYPSETKIKAEVKSQKELDYQYPESLMLSIMACTNADWEAFHTALRHVPQGMSKLDKIGFPIRFYYF
jgi:hypothetical protein